MRGLSQRTDGGVVRSRAGMGALLVLVMLILGILGLMGFSSYFQSSGTGRTYTRIVSIRSTLEVAESAIVEAFTYVRLSVTKNTSFAQCPDNWRSLIIAAAQDPTNLALGKRVQPFITRQLPTTLGVFGISDVNVDIVALSPAQPGSPIPNGVLEFAVTVKSTGKMMSVQKTVRQRRAFFLYPAPAPRGTPRRPMNLSTALIKMLLDPLATVID
jgi:hypothetical protein